ncbi:MAG: FliH/SctL family protein [Candidatus Sulfotelmatobacter sp.]
MSSSASLAPEPAKVAGSLVDSEALEASPFSYSEAVTAAGQLNFPLAAHRSSSSSSWGLGGSENDPAAQAAGAEREVRMREAARQEGLAESRAKFEEKLGAERAAVELALKDFARERAAYYRRLEEEAVRLVMSIARKVLHREAQVDPLLLMGIVRVALERIEGAAGVALAVHPQQAQEWRRYLAAHLEAGEMPEIVEDAVMQPQQCVLRTSMGTADLSLETQLKEVEQGLMDLLAARPQGKR